MPDAAPASENSIWPDQRRPLRLPEPEVHHFQTQDGVTLKLVRYKGGDTAPVIFSHGNGTSTKVALLDTIDINLAEYIVGRGRDLWLLDWRASPDIGYPGYSFEQGATYDWPAAVDYVLASTGAAQVDCAVFCAGGIALLMSLASGRMKGLIRSAALLQASLFFCMPWLARAKACAFIAETVETLGWRTYRQDARNPAWPYRLMDAALKLQPVPPGDRCNSPSCQRMTFCYGSAARHSNLNAATHDRLPEVYGAGSVRSICNLAQAVRRGSIVTVDDAALDNLRLPITFIHGEQNTLILAESSRRMHLALVARHGAGLHEVAVVPGYGHFDSMVGDNAARDVFPIIGAHLDRWSQASAAA